MVKSSIFKLYTTKYEIYNNIYIYKTYFVSRRNGRVHLNRRGASVQLSTGSRGVSISGSNAGYTMFRGSVKGTGYPLHSPVSPSLPLPYVTEYHHVSTGILRFCYLTQAPDGVWWSIPRAGCFTSGKTLGSRCTGGCVGLRAGLDGHRKSPPPLVFGSGSYPAHSEWRLQLTNVMSDW